MTRPQMKSLWRCYDRTKTRKQFLAAARNTDAYHDRLSDAHLLDIWEAFDVACEDVLEKTA